jgi:mono/diheme cytochrome c family protein
MFIRKIIIFCLLLLAFTSCERSSKQIADKSTTLEENLSVSSDVRNPSVHTNLSIAGIAEVLPIDASEQILDGQALFIANCSACHQVTGQGIPGVFPPLANSSYVTSDNIERLSAIMIYGLSGPITVNGMQYNSVMAGLGQTMNDAELAAVATYIRSSWGNSASEVKADTFSEIRKKYGSRGLFAINELGEDK